MKNKIARRGEFWAINDKRTRGHKSYIVRGNRKNPFVDHIPITHKETTRHMANKRLIQNPQHNKSDDSYLLPKIQRAHEKSLGKKQTDMQIKNVTDKSVRRNIIKRNRKKK